MLSIPMEFLVSEGEDERHFAAVQCREDISQAHDSMRTSTLMRIFDIEAFLARKARTTGKLTASMCAELYDQNLTFATSSEKVSESFVDMATCLVVEVRFGLNILDVKRFWGLT